MLTVSDFVDHVLGVSRKTTAKSPGHIDDLDFADAASEGEASKDARFVTPLFQACFGLGQAIPRDAVIRSTDPVAKHIPDEVRYWPKTLTRPHHTLLIEADISNHDLLAIPAFNSRQLAHLDIVEDALARMVAETLDGFERGSARSEASTMKGLTHETLCVFSIIDKREGHEGRIACFGTVNAITRGLETFFLSERPRLWDRTMATERLSLIFERQFAKLGSPIWQDAFTTSEERERAEALLNVCTGPENTIANIQECVLDLLETIASNFGLNAATAGARRLSAFNLPPEHDIGMHSDERDKYAAGDNPFGGIVLRDPSGALLGYLIYPVRNEASATRLREELSRHNRFHNVLVICPAGNQASIELWQGTEQLTGRLRKTNAQKDAAEVVSLLSRFFVVSKAKVRNPTELAEELAYRARYLRRLTLRQLQSESESGPLRSMFNDFRSVLLHDLTHEKFADAYAQTITYGLLTARWAGSKALAASGERLTRISALKYIPVSSPFLRGFFQTALTMRLEELGRLLWLADDVADLLDRIDVEYVFGAGDPESSVVRDPIIHFYEPFLEKYDPVLKKDMGVFYTPKPVVAYIVRSVHEILRNEFNLSDGLADTSTWAQVIERNPRISLPRLSDDPQEFDCISPDEPFIQILDPSTGTGTFLVEVIELIHQTLTRKWTESGMSSEMQTAEWNSYVPKHLLPRLYAYELLMAPYAIAHMKVGLKLAETGYFFGTAERARIYLTNSLDKVQQLKLVGFDALATEAASVVKVKRHKRFTVVIGNPPYKGESSNPSRNKDKSLTYIGQLIQRYFEFKGAPLKEKQTKWLQDDYVKFFRLAEAITSHTGTGVVGLITNHGFLENPTFRGMRESLLATFSKMWLVDLGGNRKKGVKGDAAADENVFPDIEQGTAITIAIRPSTTHADAIYHTSLRGTAHSKYQALGSSSIRQSQFSTFEPQGPFLLLVPPNSNLRPEWERFYALNEIMPKSSLGIVSGRDGFAIAIDKPELAERIKYFCDPKNSDTAVALRFGIKDKGGYVLAKRRQHVVGQPPESFIRKINYRPFDSRFIAYSRGFLTADQRNIMQHLGEPTSLALATTRTVETGDFSHVFCTRSMMGHHFVSIKESNYAFPLFLKSQESPSSSQPGEAVVPNLTAEFRGAVLMSTQLSTESQITAESYFHYIYAILHSPEYRARYSDFLKSDYPRIPLPRNVAVFNELCVIGGELIELHLLESPKNGGGHTTFIGGQDTVVRRVAWANNTVWIDAPVCNKGQVQGPGRCGFRGVPNTVWSFRIGGYNVCEKWLTDRKGLSLSHADLEHYGRVVTAISKTIELMAGIDTIINRHGGWIGAFNIAESARD
jgi:hypothetical protein